MVASFALGGPLGAAMGVSANAGAALGIGAGVLQQAIGGAIISLAGMALMNAVVPAPKPSVPSLSFGSVGAPPAPSPTYSLSAQGNEARLGQPIPVLYGRHLIYPDLATQPYQEFVNNEQYLFQLHVIGQGEFDLEQVRIEDTPIASFEEVETEIVGTGGSVTCFVKAYPAETTEAFCDGHVSAFEFFGGVPQSIVYDNTKIAVARILGNGKRKRTRVFSELVSHYLFKDRFGRPGKGNDKGKVEGMVGYTRRNFMVPEPRFATFDDLNAYLGDQCRKRMNDTLRGHKNTIGERFAADLAALQPLPAVAYDACDKQSARVSFLSLVRYRGNDYSVPTQYGHQQVLVRGFVHEVVIACGAEIIARHPRSWEKEDYIFNPLHYLALLEQKTNALDQAAPLQNWELPKVFQTLRRLLEARMGKAGKREFVQVLRLLETFQLADVEAAVKSALERGAIGFDAVKHLMLCRIERRPPRLDMTLYPYLPRAHVTATSASDYMALLTGGQS